MTNKIQTHENPMREQAYRVPPPRFHEGIPSTPKYMLWGTTYIAIDDARICLMERVEGKGVIRVGVCSDSGQQAKILKRPDEPELDQPIPVAGAEFRFTVHSAFGLSSMLGRSYGVDSERMVTRPADAEKLVDCGECASMTVTTQEKDLSCWIFLRSWDSPYALRIHLTLDDAKLFSSKITELVAEMTSEDWDAATTKLDIPCFIGAQTEEGPKQYDGPRTYFDKPAAAAEPAEEAKAQAAPSPQPVPEPLPSAPPHELAARQIFGAFKTIAKNVGTSILKRVFR